MFTKKLGEKVLYNAFVSSLTADATATCLGHMGSEKILEGSPRVRSWMSSYGFANGLAIGVAIDLALVGSLYIGCKAFENYCKKNDYNIPCKTPFYAALGLATLKHLHGVASWF